MSRKPYHDQVARLFALALSKGAKRLSLTQVEWDVAGDCLQPVTRETVGRPSVPLTDPDASSSGSTRIKVPQRFRYPSGPPYWGAAMSLYKAAGVGYMPKRLVVTPARRGTKVTLSVIIHAKCRKCERCLRKRASHWRLRALAETRMSSRTWFGTLTLSPGSHQTMLDRARHVMRQRGATDFEALPDAEQFALRHAQVSVELTKYLKRIRKASGARFRYLVVAEAHASGLPHYHVLLHEWGLPVREKVLSQQWQLGFSKWRIVEPEQPHAAAYLCKYLSKSALARVRASGRYGQGHLTSTTVSTIVPPKGDVETDPKKPLALQGTIAGSTPDDGPPF